MADEDKLLMTNPTPVSGPPNLRAALRCCDTCRHCQDYGPLLAAFGAGGGKNLQCGKHKVSTRDSLVCDDFEQETSE